jgi:hypothetical protein
MGAVGVVLVISCLAVAIIRYLMIARIGKLGKRLAGFPLMADNRPL